ncbi:MAG: NAD(+)/NADH kinase [Dissulfurispiraceae bacterium]|jgi:NAD+ kinase
MKKIGIICKSGRTEPIELVKLLIPWLKERQCEVALEWVVAEALGLKGVEREEIPGTVRMMIVLGGDGTMLSVARLIDGRDVPILGVNLGGLGFITEINKDEIFGALNQALEGNSPVEERMMLDIRVLRQSMEVGNFTALNDGVINKGAMARIIEMETFVNTSYVTTYRADGLIISTPTGSTAYNLAAGGPILYPTLSSIIVAPICPHMLTNRPVVLPDNSDITIALKTETESVYLTVDGQVGIPLHQGDIIEVKKSDSTTKIFTPCGHDYFNLLRTKLKWGER